MRIKAGLELALEILLVVVFCNWLAGINSAAKSMRLIWIAEVADECSSGKNYAFMLKILIN